MDEDRARWDERYAARAADPPRAPDALRAAGLDDAMLDPPGSQGDRHVLDVAAGLGPVARWAARRGAHVVALDVSPVAVAALDASDEANSIDARCVDLDDGLPSDLGLFDLVVCQRFRSADVIAALPGHVAPGGTLVVTVLSEVGADEPGPFHAAPGELRRLLDERCGNWSALAETEGGGEASLVLRRPVDHPVEATAGGSS